MKYLVVLILIISTSCCIESEGKGEEVKIVSWNVQNLFDGVDSGEEYSDFEVEGGEWSEELYRKRLNLISSVIEGIDPDIVGLQEIEGVDVLRDLCEILGYTFCFATDSTSAIEVGFLSKYPIVQTGVIKVGDSSSGLRDILEVNIDIDGEELILFNNHWKSKSGGFSEDRRIISALALKSRLQEIEEREFIILGDLNENYNEEELVQYPTALTYNYGEDGLLLTTSESIDSGELFTPWESSSFEGSYRYRGEWESIDHFLFSPKLMDSSGFIFKSFSVYRGGDLLRSDGSVNRWLTYRGEGYSDHLPVVAEIELYTDVLTTLE